MGGIAHNAGETSTAVFLGDNIRLVYYFIPLVLNRLAAGVLIGLASGILIRQLAQMAPNMHTGGRKNS